MELTLRNADSSIIQDKPFAYFVSPLELDKNGEFIVCVAVQDVKGFWKTDWQCFNAE